MQTITGAILLLAASVCLAGYEIASALNKFQGGALPFLGWAFGLTGIAFVVIGWMDESKKQAGRDKNETKHAQEMKPKSEK